MGLSILTEAANLKNVTLKGDGDIYYDADGNIITDATAVNVTSKCVSGTKFVGCKINLANDIDLNNENWAGIGTEEANFCGTFDGCDHTIKNLSIVETEAKEGKAYLGFFAKVCVLETHLLQKNMQVLVDILYIKLLKYFQMEK